MSGFMAVASCKRRQRIRKDSESIFVATHLYCLGESLVMIDRVSVGLDGYLLLHTGLHNAIAFGFVLRIREKDMD